MPDRQDLTASPSLHHHPGTFRDLFPDVYRCAKGIARAPLPDLRQAPSFKFQHPHSEETDQQTGPQALALTLYGDFRPSHPVDDPASTTVPKATVSNNTFTGALSAAYKRGGDFAVGLEAFTQQTGHAYADPTDLTALKTLLKIGLSFWGWYNFNDFLGALA